MKYTRATFMTFGVFSAVLTLTLNSCGKPSSPSTAPTIPVAWQAIIEDQLQAFSNAGLPEVTQDEVDDFLEMMELADGHDRTAKRFQTRLAEADTKRMSAALLAIVEGRSADPIDKSRAYGWLRAGDEAMVPRLTLRLKYEKDWLANVDIALTLLAHGSGAGLQALVHILEVESDPNQNSLSLARYAAMETLKSLPPSATWQPSDDFAANWKRLVEVQSYWDLHRQLPDLPPVTPSRDQQAELWRMIQRLRSQPLRPVDDARFVLVRLPDWVFEPLSSTIFDEDRYVREHALQTLAWIGYPVGRWAEKNSVDLSSRYSAVIHSADLRPRVMEAMGASGLSSMQETLLVWLRRGNLEEITAAADALLRCADASAFAELSTLLATDALLSPEARYSLQLLLTADDAIDDLALPQGLDSSEAKRRRQWRVQRADDS